MVLLLRWLFAFLLLTATCNLIALALGRAPLPSVIHVLRRALLASLGSHLKIC